MRSFRRHPAGRKAYSKRKASGSKSLTTRSAHLATAVKRVMFKNAETKGAMNLFYIGLYHNIPITFSSNLLACTQGVADTMRIGDGVQGVGVQLKMLFEQKPDRPNVTYKVFVFETAATDAYAYSDWFRAVSGDFLLDDINTDRVKCIKSMTFKPPVADSSQESGAAQHSVNYIKKMWIPYRRHIRYATNGGTLPYPKTLQLIVAGYDALGTLLTDNIATVRIHSTFFFKDI